MIFSHKWLIFIVSNLENIYIFTIVVPITVFRISSQCFLEVLILQ